MQDFKNNRRKRIGPVREMGTFVAILLCIVLLLSQLAVRLVKEDGDLLLEGDKSIAGIQGEPKDTIDVLVVGDSESYTTVSPMQLWKEQGVPSYVCGQPGQEIQQSYYMLKTALKTQSPKVVLLETNVIYRYKGRASGLQLILDEMRSYYFPIFRFHDIWKPLLTGQRYPQVKYKGFQIRTGVKAYQGGAYMEETTKKKEIEKLNLYYMDKIIKLCQDKGAELLLYSGPSPINYDSAKHNGLAELAKKRGLSYLDLNMKLTELGIDWKTDTLDKGDHLNLSGAEKVTQYLGEYLTRVYELRDRRKEPGYESWHTEAERFEGETIPQLWQIRGDAGEDGKE